MGQQIAFILLIILAGMILTQIILLAKKLKNQNESILDELKVIKEKLGK